MLELVSIPAIVCCVYWIIELIKYSRLPLIIYNINNITYLIHELQIKLLNSIKLLFFITIGYHIPKQNFIIKRINRHAHNINHIVRINFGTSNILLINFLMCLSPFLKNTFINYI